MSRCFYQNNKKKCFFIQKEAVHEIYRTTASFLSEYGIQFLIFECLLQIIRNLLKFFLCLSLLHCFKNFFYIIKYKSY